MTSVFCTANRNDVETSKVLQLTGTASHTLTHTRRSIGSNLRFLPKFAVFALLKFAVLSVFLLQFPEWWTSVARSCVQLPLLVAVGGGGALQTYFSISRWVVKWSKQDPPQWYFVSKLFEQEETLLPLDADDGRVSCFLQHFIPFILISTDLVPVDEK